jgi:anti-sigma regulatory factor (Ser/Thr protein kinase)
LWRKGFSIAAGGTCGDVPETASRSAAGGRFEPGLADGGRGLWLISQLVDEVRLERAGQGTLLSLRRRAESKVACGV